MSTISILGTGRIGKMHAELIHQQVPGLDLVAVFDVHEDSARSVAANLGCNQAGSVEEVLASNVDAVAICTSTDTHVDLAIAAAEAGKAIFLEKPVSLELAEVDRAVAAIDAAGVPIHIGFNRRYDAAHAAVQQAVANGAVGDLHMLRITSRDPEPPPIDYIKVSGGMFIDMTIHDFDMARFVTGSEITEVYTKAAVRVDQAIGEAGDVDTAVVVLTHENGCITTIDNSRQAVYGYDQRVEAFGSGGMAVSENPRNHTAELHTTAGTRQENIPYSFLIATSRATCRAGRRSAMASIRGRCQFRSVMVARPSLPASQPGSPITNIDRSRPRKSADGPRSQRHCPQTTAPSTTRPPRSSTDRSPRRSV